MSLVHQDILLAHLKQIFPGEYTQLNVKKNHTLKNPTTGAYVEFDIWFPNLEICFEFQDEYHYITTWYYHSSRTKIAQKDYVKKVLAQQSGVTLVDIPCWWDGSKDSLVATINFHRPDLVSASYKVVDPISLNPPPGFLHNLEIPGIGELMLASFPMDSKFVESIAPDTWWMGEKYDGVRCGWNYSRQKLYSRAGRVIKLLPQFIALMPRCFLDSELWFGRGHYDCMYTLLKGAPEYVLWHLLRIISFDTPASFLRNRPFETRYEYILSAVNPGHPFQITVARVLFLQTNQLNMFVHSIIDSEGEGVIMRERSSLYLPGRSRSLIKLKTSQSDAEGIVTNVGKDGTIQIKLPSGKIFDVPPSDILIPTPSIGAIVSFSFESQSRRDLPQSPKVFRIRTDLEWEDVVRNFAKEQRFLNESSKAGYTSQQIGHWTAKNMRLFLEKFAKDRNMDPLLAETWYNLSSSLIREEEGGNVVVNKFKGGYFSTIQALFPDIGVIKNRWVDAAKRRKFFEKYARDRNFDPLIPANWYSQTREQILSVKGASEVVAYHHRSVYEALMDLFPNIGLQRTKLYRNYVKEFFIKYAKHRGFDPNVPANWYSQSFAQIESHPGASTVLAYFHGNAKIALLSIFPDIGFDKSKFSYVWVDTRRKTLWVDPKRRKRFFENYAKQNNFDPLHAERWYSHSRSKILALEGSRRVLSYHNNSVAQALSDLFPNIGFSKLKYRNKNLWGTAESRRQFFERYAQDYGFDPLVPENWYSQAPQNIWSRKGAKQIMRYHGSNIPKALVALFFNIGLRKSKFKLKF